MTLFGFGLVNGVGFKPAFDLQKSNMEIVSEKECKEFIENLQLSKSNGMFCARSPGRSACNVNIYLSFFVVFFYSVFIFSFFLGRQWRTTDFKGEWSSSWRSIVWNTILP